MTRVLRDTWLWFKREPWMFLPPVIIVWRIMTPEDERIAHVRSVLNKEG